MAAFAASPPTDAGLSVTLEELIGLRHKAIELPLPDQLYSRSTLPGSQHSRQRGRGIDFDQLRAYQAGDDIRSIDWRVTARTQKPHSRMFHEERDRPVLLLVEQSLRLYFGSARMLKSVLAARTAALLGWNALALGERVGGLLFGDQEQLLVRAQRGKQSLLRLLYLLQGMNQSLTQAGAPPPTSATLSRALTRAQTLVQPGGLAILLCDERALDPAAEQQLTLLANRIELLLLPLYDPLDHDLPHSGRLAFRQGAERLELDSYDRRLQEGYRQLAQQRGQQWQHLARRLGAGLLPLHTAEEPQAQLQRRGKGKAR